MQLQPCTAQVLPPVTCKPGLGYALGTSKHCHSFKAGCWIGSSLKRRLHSTRSRENLSSGEKRAGCAEKVGEPSGAAFCSIMGVPEPGTWAWQTGIPVMLLVHASQAGVWWCM